MSRARFGAAAAGVALAAPAAAAFVLVPGAGGAPRAGPFVRCAEDRLARCVDHGHERGCLVLDRLERQRRDGASTARRTPVACREFGRMPSDSGQRTLPDHVHEDMKGTTYELFILAMSILSIVNLLLLAIFSWGSENWLLILYVDIALTLIFLGDFSYRLATATSKRRYLGRGGGVLDLLSCVPALRIFRLFRIVRALRIIRRLGGAKMVRDLRSEIAAGTVYLVVFMLTVVLEVVGLLELRFEENAQGANITTAGDALWWGYVTATTVGYGDQYPVTRGGRLVGYLMLTVGVALFATFSGFLANTFLSKRDPKPATPVDGDLEAALRNMERLLAEQQQATERLRAGLAELQAPKSS